MSKGVLVLSKVRICRFFGLSRIFVALVVFGVSLTMLISCSDQSTSPSPTNDGPIADDFDPDATGAYKDMDRDGFYHHVDGCSDCHDIRTAFNNLMFIKDTISTPASGDKDVQYTAQTGANSLADGDTTYDGACEVCHTSTLYHRNDASGDHSHYPGFNCVVCHAHASEFIPFGGAGQSHARHTAGGDDNHLALDCDYCHTGDPQVFQDGQPFETTTVCNDCHSPGGVVDGVDDPEVGARSNWVSGIYAGDDISSGKEQWCTGCHDLGNSIIEGVSASPVGGNGTWGYFSTGHGRANSVTCGDCHDLTANHIDGVAHTYRAAEDNYQVGYRLISVNGGVPLLIPRIDGNIMGPFSDPPYYNLCFQCHDKYALFGGPLAPAGPYYSDEMRTNFRNDSPMIIPDGLGTDISHLTLTGVGPANSHATHVSGIPHSYDSDHDGVMDSRNTCVACHNVHGSTVPVMIRDGFFVGHETGLNFAHVRFDRHEIPHIPCADAIWMTSADVSREESHGGIMRSTTGQNGVCTFCHCSGGTTGDPEYMANCQGVSCVDYYRSYVVPPTPGTLK